MALQRLSLVLLVAALLSGCRGGGSPAQLTSAGSSPPPTAVATTTILADMVRVVGGAHVSVTSLLGPGVDPHTFNPLPSDVRTLAEAGLVFVNGVGLDDFMEPLIENAGGNSTIVVVSDGLTPRASREDLEHEDEEHGDEEHGDEHGQAGEADPHFWMSPYHAQQYVRNIRDALIAADPAHAADYEANAAAYLTELEALDEWIKAQTAAIPTERRVLVTNHDTLGYFAERYGYAIAGVVIPGVSAEAEPSARTLTALADTIRESGVPAIFTETTVSPKFAQQLAAEVGQQVKVVPLYTDSLGPAGSEADSYLEMIRYDATAIRDALR